MSNTEKCKTCRWWQDYKDRVWANLSGMDNYPHDRGLELRACKFKPPPGVRTFEKKYTDEDYVCSAYERSR